MLYLLLLIQLVFVIFARYWGSQLVDGTPTNEHYWKIGTHPHQPSTEISTLDISRVLGFLPFIISYIISAPSESMFALSWIQGVYMAFLSRAEYSPSLIFSTLNFCYKH